MKRLYAITGTPGTGKKTVAPLVAERMGLDHYSLNDLAEARGLVEPTGEVDTTRLRRLLPSWVKGKAIISGHLVPYSLARIDVACVAVLRCEPMTLRKRLDERGYQKDRISANLESELIGTLAHDSRTTFGEYAFEVDSTLSSPDDVAKKVARGFTGLRPRTRIEWSSAYDSAAKLRALFR